MGATGVLLALLAPLAVLGAPARDAVHQLPGWHGPLPSQWYSGFVNLSASPSAGSFADGYTDIQSHYIFIESEGDPSKDPVILWSNGGPGASSMFGIMAELGPLLLNDQSLRGPVFDETGIPQLLYNPNAWTQVGSLLMFDWPPPVGFSSCGGDTGGDGMSCGSWNDTRAANAEFAALRGWFDDLFPEYKKNDLYLTGESYAGIYIPMLAERVLEDASAEPLNLKGFAVGDACTGTDVLCGSAFGPWWDVVFFYGHGQFSNKLFNDIMATCGMEALQNGQTSGDCNTLISQMYQEIGGYYAYNLYDDCIYEDDLRRRRLTTSEAGSNPLHTPGAALNDYVCGGGNAQEVWVAQPAVRRALNVPVDANFFSGDNGDGMVYNLTEANLLPFYHSVATDYPGVRVLVYNGDTDPGINSFASQNWTVAVGLEETAGWRPWTLDGCKRMGGYVTEYADGDFAFLTIRGSGHMVPQFKPEAALEFISTWIAGEEWKPYDASCSAPPAVASSRVKRAKGPILDAQISSLERQIEALRLAREGL
mmetsp:Transcript_9529/g.27004  ORF Transcript_9529/g.27004 Transcript_9529/m.27004 type:complete len:536 (-) Transcript_9529:359-1966(-)